MTRRSTVCHGCQYDYQLMHLLRKHRRDAQCGSRFAAEEVRKHIEQARYELEEMSRLNRYRSSRSDYF